MVKTDTIIEAVVLPTKAVVTFVIEYEDAAVILEVNDVIPALAEVQPSSHDS